MTMTTNPNRTMTTNPNPFPSSLDLDRDALVAVGVRALRLGVLGRLGVARDVLREHAPRLASLGVLGGTLDEALAAAVRAVAHAATLAGSATNRDERRDALVAAASVLASTRDALVAAAERVAVEVEAEALALADAARHADRRAAHVGGDRSARARIVLAALAPHAGPFLDAVEHARDVLLVLDVATEAATGGKRGTLGRSARSARERVRVLVGRASAARLVALALGAACGVPDAVPLVRDRAAHAAEALDALRGARRLVAPLRAVLDVLAVRLDLDVLVSE
jgi:hypothetical protein